MSESLDDLREQAAARTDMARRVKKMIVERLDLPIEPDWITIDQPLVGRGLELDSIDVLELIIGIEAEFDIAITDEEVAAFGSVGKLVERVETGAPLDVRIGVR